MSGSHEVFMKKKMKAKTLLLWAVAMAHVVNTNAAAETELVPSDKDKQVQDTIKMYQIDEIIITSNTKETNDYRNLPGAISLISPQVIVQQQVSSMRDLSALVPNLHIPEYGSKMSSAIYLRGTGNRSTGEAVGLYVDNVPYLEKSAFDFDLTDIAHIEVLRGPQGTLYGRNAMGGIINIHTINPFDFQGNKASLSYGNYGQLAARFSHYSMLTDELGISAGVRYDRHDGFFVNLFDGKKMDEEESVGGHVRVEYRPSDALKMSLRYAMDYADQGAFPYGVLDPKTGKVGSPNQNTPGAYNRQTHTASYALQYINDHFTLSSTTGYQWMDDEMRMDSDYSPLAVFDITQKQRSNSLSQELTLKGNTESNYHWTLGAYGFYKNLHTSTPITMGEVGVKTMLQAGFDKIPPHVGKLTVLDNSLCMTNDFKMPSYGIALYHESTYNFDCGLSITGGIRAEYEKQSLTYDGRADLNVSFETKIPNLSGNYTSSPRLFEDISHDFWQVSPKLAVKYDFNDDTHIYASVAKGHKTGGYNIQMANELLQTALQTNLMEQIMPKRAGGNALTMEQVSMFDPEHSWNYEVGARSELVDNRLKVEATLFLMDVSDLQMTKFTPAGDGRMVVNAGETLSYGAELSLTARLMEQLTLNANYGYAHSEFKNYDREVVKKDGSIEVISYKGNIVPYTPAHTLNASLNYIRPLQNMWLDQCYLTVGMNGAGKIYWNEENSASQNFYAMLNARVGVRKGLVSFGLWGRNLTDTQYAAFYFESFGQKLAQAGRPLQAGAEISLSF